jgi:AraC-like DNA-binding protein
MDKLCIWLEKVIAWLDRGEAPAIPYVGQAAGAFRNPPVPHLEICYVVEGSYPELKVGDRQECIPSGHATLHSVHLGNYSPLQRPPPRTWCLFLDVADERVFEPLARAPLFCSTPVRNREGLVQCFERLATRCRAAKPLPSRFVYGPVLYSPAKESGTRPALAYQVKAALLDLLAHLLDEAQTGQAGGEDAATGSVRRAVEFMGLHYREADVDLGAVADAAHLSIDHFGRVFRSEAGMTPMRYLKLVRIDQSQFLLQHTELLVEEVAREVGFEDPLHFSRVFRQVTGRSPTAYRAESRAR